MDLEKILKNELYRAIIEFFHENQSSIDTPRGVATWVKEERSTVKRALDRLVQYGILIDHQVPSTTGYSYTRNKKLIKEIEQQLENER